MPLWPAVGMLGLLGYFCAAIFIVLTWKKRSRRNVTIWFVGLAVMGGLSIGLLFVR
jgi:hypothetical protein